MCFTNGKGATKEAALCSALGEFIERLTAPFYNDQYFGGEIAQSEFVTTPTNVGLSSPKTTAYLAAF